MLDLGQVVRTSTLLGVCGTLLLGAACRQTTDAGGTRGQGGNDGTGTGGASVAPQGGAGGTPDGVGGTATAGSGGTSVMVGADAAIGDTASSPCNGVVCDDFETYMTGKGFGPWRLNGVGGTVAVNETHAFSGKQSMQFVSLPGANRRTQLQRTGAPIFPATNNAFWGRMMVWADSLPGKSDAENKNVHYDIIQASGTGPGEYRIAGMGNVLLNYEPHDCYYGGAKPIPQGKWTCWEWTYDGANNRIEFYIDNKLQALLVEKGQGCVDGTSSVWMAPIFNTLRIGFVNYQSKAETTTLWVDDFAAGPSRIGCPVPTGDTH